MENNNSYFDGGLLQLIGWRLLGILITVCTLGICYPWAFCMVYRWETKHTVVDGRRLVFDGTALQLFRQLGQVAAAVHRDAGHLWLLAVHCAAQVENQAHALCSRRLNAGFTGLPGLGPAAKDKTKPPPLRSHTQRRRFLSGAGTGIEPATC